jgi:outer membrane protein assembly factor BamB
MYHHTFGCIISQNSIRLITIIATVAIEALVLADDWPMRGRTIHRCSSVESHGSPHFWELSDGPHLGAGPFGSKDRSGFVKWSAGGFRESSCDPVVSNGLVWIGTADPIGESNEDSSVLACFDEKTGELLYQHISRKLADPSQDWPNTGNTSSPFIRNNRLWLCTNRLEVICLNTQPLIERSGEPSVEWSVDLKSRFNVIPTDVHLGNRASRCSIAGVDGRIFINTTNSRHYELTPQVDPDAPSLVCLNENTGETIWTDNSPGTDIARNQYCNPVIFRNGNTNYVAIGQGDGFVRAFECETGKPVWKFDLNPRLGLKERAERGRAYSETRFLTESPSFDGRYLYFAIGDDREFTLRRTGGVYCIDPFGTGDISPEIFSDGKAAPNPNSKLVWDFTESGGKAVPVSLGGLCVTEKHVLYGDTAGIVRCFDKLAGTIHWSHETFSGVSATPLVVGDTLYIADEDGDVEVLSATSTFDHIATINHDAVISSSPVYANDTLFVVTRERLYAIGSGTR